MAYVVGCRMRGGAWGVAGKGGRQGTANGRRAASQRKVGSMKRWWCILGPSIAAEVPWSGLLEAS